MRVDYDNYYQSYETNLLNNINLIIFFFKWTVLSESRRGELHSLGPGDDSGNLLQVSTLIYKLKNHDVNIFFKINICTYLSKISINTHKMICYPFLGNRKLIVNIQKYHITYVMCVWL